MPELISVIVPIYHVEKYLQQCIESIQNQTYRNLEIILVDDGSDDKCPEICDYYAGSDPRIKVIHKENGGIDSARKAGIMAATGKYVGYVDGDDWIEPEMYEELLGYVHKYDVEVVESGVIDSWSDVEKKRVPYIQEGCYKGEEFIEKVEPRILYAGIFFRHGVFVYLCTKLLLREKVMKYQMISDLTNIIQNDTMVSLPCITETKSLYIAHNCYYHYRVRTDSDKRKSKADEVPNFIECYPEFFSRFRGTLLCTDGDKQIMYYAMFYLLEKTPYAFDNLENGDFLVPFGNLKVQDKIVIYGAGATGIHLENYIRSIKETNIVCWADQNYQHLQDSLNVCAPKEITTCNFDYVIIAILRENMYKSAKEDLIVLGVPEDKILWIEQKYIDNPELLLRKVVYQGKTLI